MTRIIVRLLIGILVPCVLLTLATTIFGFWQTSTEIAYICPAFYGRFNRLCLTDADRGTVVRLTGHNLIVAYNVVWSPDGRRLAMDGDVYQYSTDGRAALAFPGLYVLDRYGGHPVRLVESGFDPAWSPDSTQIAYSQANGADYRTGWSIFSTTLTGSKRLIFSSSATNRNPVWSPDGTQIAFQSLTYSPYQSDIYIMKADGSDLRRVTAGDSIYFDPAWSPDGTKLAYFWAGDWDRDILVRDLASGETHNLTAAFSGVHGYDGSPVWSPDGQRIAFDSDVGHPNQWEIYIMHADGSGVYRVARGRRPAWRPPRTFSWTELWARP